MAADGRSIYDPMNVTARNTEGQDGGIGLNDKNPTPTLRIFGSNLGNQWLNYGSVGGGTQDWTPPPPQTNGPGSCTWFRFYYTGIMEIAGEAVFGNWKVLVEGEGLEPTANQMAKHTKTSLKVGEKSNNIAHPVSVKAITIEPYRPVRQLFGEEEADDDEGAIGRC